MRIIPLILVAAFTPMTSAEIYRCTDSNGGAVFSDKPCGADAETVHVDIPSSTGMDMGSGGDFSEVERGNAIRAADRRVGRVKEYISRLERDYSKEVSRINDKLSGLSNSKLDRGTREKLLAQKRKASSTYRQKRSKAYRELGEARAERITSRVD
jgi:hypothetical protein